MEDNSSDSFILDQDVKPKFLENIMIQKLDKKKSINITSEIRKRKKIFNRYIKSEFGPDFFKIKPESYCDLVDRCKTFYFSPYSKFMSNFPKLRNKLLKERNINNYKLQSKINVGELLYLAEARKKKHLDQNDQKNERLMAFSKNFATQDTKDLISNEVIKVKFWDKNKKIINKVLKNRFYSIFNNFVQKNEEQLINEKKEEDKKGNLTLINKIVNKLENAEMTKENKRYNPLQSYINNIYKLNQAKKIHDKHTNIENNDNIKESYNNNNSLKDSSFPSIINNTISLKTFSNENDKINNIKSINTLSRNSKILESKNKYKTSFNSSLRTGSKNNSTSCNYKKNISNKVIDLNSQTHLCNKKLFKLISNNQTIFPEKRIKNSDKDFDINYSLSETSNNFSNWKKNHRGTFSYLSYEKLNSTKENNLKGEKISEIIKEAKSNLNSSGKFRKRELKNFPKKILEIKDEYALQMVDLLFSKNKIKIQRMPEIKETIKEQKEAKEHRNINVIRRKAKNNHNKIVRMAFHLAKEKDRFYLNNNKINSKKRNLTEIKNNN